MADSPPPVLSRPLLTFIVVVVVALWTAAGVAALYRPDRQATFVTATTIMAIIVGALYGIRLAVMRGSNGNGNGRNGDSR